MCKTDLAQKFKPIYRMGPMTNRVRAMVLCNPHNPVGRVWTKEELTRMGEIVLQHKAVMISDEIHCELLFKGQQHIPFATLSKEFEQQSITCMAPSKTFNLAGLDTSIIIIPNPPITYLSGYSARAVIASEYLVGLDRSGKCDFHSEK